MNHHASASVLKVLLVRTNAYSELFNTRSAVDVVRTAFPSASITAVTTPQSEGKLLLEADTRLDEVLLFPPENAAVNQKSPKAFLQFMRRQPFDATVFCYGATPGLDYSKHLLSTLLCPGYKFILDAEGKLAPIKNSGILLLYGKAAGMITGNTLRRVGTTSLNRIKRGLVRRHVQSTFSIGAEKLRRVLWIRVDGIGDVVMTLPALHTFKKQFPLASVDVLVRPLSAPLLEGLPEISQVLTFESPDAPKSTRDQSGRLSWLSLRRELRRRRYDLAVDIAGRDVGRALAFLSGARLRLSPAQSIYDLPGQSNYAFLMTHPVPMPVQPQPAVENFLSLLRATGLAAEREAEPYRLPVAPEKRQAVREKLASLGVQGSYAVIHARSAEDAKDWPPERFGPVAAHLVHSHGLAVVLTGTPRDREYNECIRRNTSPSEAVYDATGVFALAELPALLADAGLMVTVDTGPMHIAAMVGTPLVALFLPWFVQRDQPYGQPDAVLTPFSGTTFPVERAEEFWQGRLLDGIRVEDVIAAMDRKLKAPPHD